uniref:C-type lectin domain-containing protein n=1 Tax=Oryzias latipes TaxID=8090 RepID=A0A3P9JLA7_ORYLA
MCAQKGSFVFERPQILFYCNFRSSRHVCKSAILIGRIDFDAAHQTKKTNLRRFLKSEASTRGVFSRRCAHSHWCPLFSHEALNVGEYRGQIRPGVNRLLDTLKIRCPSGWIRFGSSCYFFSVESKSWDEARKSCRARGADLVVINTKGEKTFLVAFRDEPVWIGLTDKAQEGTWKWVDGSPLTLNDGGDKLHGEEDCAEIRETPGFWNDLACGTSLRWICEKEATLFV